jgi:DNA polymerase (family 10)
MAISRKDAVAVLEEIAMWLDLQGANPFKIRAYTNAARALPGLDGDFEELVRTGDLKKEKGFGKALVEKLQQLVETGTLDYLEDLRAEFPPTLPLVMKLNSVGPKKVKLFYEELNVTSVDELEVACKDGRIAALPGCGERTASKILASISRARESESLFLYFTARKTADLVIGNLRELPQVQRIELAGSLRRFKEVTKDVDMIASSAEPAAVMDHFVSLPEVTTILNHGSTKSSVILANGMQADLRIVNDAVFPFALHHFTGSKDHNVAMRGRAIKMGMKVSEWGLFDTSGDEDVLIPCADEPEFFKKLGLHFVPPEIRENMGEIEHAESADFPELVPDGAYRGVLHCHSHASDGSDTIQALVGHAQSFGHEYLAITDHSKSSFQANGLSPERLHAQIDSICELRKGLKDFTLFAATECDIMTDGTLDYDDDLLNRLDFTVVSVHNAFSRPLEEQTARIIRAMEHPKARILAHPTGRILLRRDAYQIDLDRILDAAIANGVAIEFNCNPSRMDLDWRLWHKARDRGVICSLNPDAHALRHFDFIRPGLGFCRKGWLTKDDIINCWPTERLTTFLATGK